MFPRDHHLLFSLSLSFLLSLARCSLVSTNRALRSMVRFDVQSMCTPVFTVHWYSHFGSIRLPRFLSYHVSRAPKKVDHEQNCNTTFNCTTHIARTAHTPRLKNKRWSPIYCLKRATNTRKTEWRISGLYFVWCIP